MELRRRKLGETFKLIHNEKERALENLNKIDN